MTAKTHISLAGHPDLTLQVKFKPLDFAYTCQGTIAVAMSDVHVHIDEVPVTVAIPFLGRRVVTSSYGPFNAHLKPFEAQFRVAGFDTRGIVGREGAGMELHGTGACKGDIEFSGKLLDELAKAAAKLVAEE
jgi:hypothetical protein